MRITSVRVIKPCKESQEQNIRIEKNFDLELVLTSANIGRKK